MTNNIFQDIKDRVDLRDLVRFYGLELDRGGFACCPFHNEKTPSFKVYEDHYHCFGCGEHGDHIDFVQNLYDISNIEAAKQISQDFGLGFDNGKIAIPVNTVIKQKNDIQMWLDEAVSLVIEYKKLLEQWEKIYSPKSPIDEVDDRYLESIHNLAYTNFYLQKLLSCSKEEQREMYKMDRDFPKRIKERLDKLDSISRKPHKRII